MPLVVPVALGVSKRTNIARGVQTADKTVETLITPPGSRRLQGMCNLQRPHLRGAIPVAALIPGDEQKGECLCRKAARNSDCAQAGPFGHLKG